MKLMDLNASFTIEILFDGGLFLAGGVGVGSICIRYQPHNSNYVGKVGDLKSIFLFECFLQLIN